MKNRILTVARIAELIFFVIICALFIQETWQTDYEITLVGFTDSSNWKRVAIVSGIAFIVSTVVLEFIDVGFYLFSSAVLLIATSLYHKYEYGVFFTTDTLIVIITMVLTLKCLFRFLLNSFKNMDEEMIARSSYLNHAR